MLRAFLYTESSGDFLNLVRVVGLYVGPILDLTKIV